MRLLLALARLHTVRRKMPALRDKRHADIYGACVKIENAILCWAGFMTIFVRDAYSLCANSGTYPIALTCALPPTSTTEPKSPFGSLASLLSTATGRLDILLNEWPAVPQLPPSLYEVMSSWTYTSKAAFSQGILR